MRRSGHKSNGRWNASQVSASAISLWDRAVQSLSSGEFQRLRLAAALGSRMTQMLYVLDEPSVGLHARDTDRLAVELTQMRDDGNTVIVVEHDLELLKKVDYLVDMGPGAGVEGGRVEGVRHSG